MISTVAISIIANEIIIIYISKKYLNKISNKMLLILMIVYHLETNLSYILT